MTEQTETNSAIQKALAVLEAVSKDIRPLDMDRLAIKTARLLES